MAAKLEKNSNGIILFDEIEKGNMEIFDYFLQILSEARITYRQKEYDLSGYYIIMTSNIGSKNIMGQDYFAIARRIVERLVKSHFRPEFLGRIRRDCQICFKPLEYETMQRIVRQKVEAEIARLQEKGYTLEYDESILPFLMNEGVNPEFGARPIVQTVQKHIALALVNANNKSGILTIKDNTLILCGVFAENKWLS
jgi:ATP-dependent Clp protease ATP-binding subunit ClpA